MFETKLPRKESWRLVLFCYIPCLLGFIVSTQEFIYKELSLTQPICCSNFYFATKRLKECYWEVLSCSDVYERSSNFQVYRWNPNVWPFKWKLLSSTFMWWCVFVDFRNDFRFLLLNNFALRSLKRNPTISDKLPAKLQTGNLWLADLIINFTGTVLRLCRSAYFQKLNKPL